jgi:uncharacterized protein YdeI (YjbR/CyaY-like superfamily)
MTVPPKPPPEPLYMKDRLEWRDWLAINHAQSASVGLIFHKKGSDKPNVTYGEAVEEAIAFGWIDGRTNKLDAERYVVRFSPRQPGSAWAPSNKVRVKKLIELGLMAPAGIAKVEAAKKDGSWDKYNDVEKMIIPADFLAALSAEEDANRNFPGFSDSVKKIILAWIGQAKRPETRRARIEEVVSLAAKGRKPKFLQPAKDRDG